MKWRRRNTSGIGADVQFCKQKNVLESIISHRMKLLHPPLLSFWMFFQTFITLFCLKWSKCHPWQSHIRNHVIKHLGLNYCWPIVLISSAQTRHWSESSRLWVWMRSSVKQWSLKGGGGSFWSPQAPHSWNECGVCLNDEEEINPNDTKTVLYTNARKCYFEI